jgi:hypothetical protein
VFTWAILLRKTPFDLLLIEKKRSAGDQLEGMCGWPSIQRVSDPGGGKTIMGGLYTKELILLGDAYPPPIS